MVRRLDRALPSAAVESREPPVLHPGPNSDNRRNRPDSQDRKKGHQMNIEDNWFDEFVAEHTLSLRQENVKTIRRYCANTGKPHNEVWQSVYARLVRQTGLDLKRPAKAWRQANRRTPGRDQEAPDGVLAETETGRLQARRPGALLRRRRSPTHHQVPHLAVWQRQDALPQGRQGPGLRAVPAPALEGRLPGPGRGRERLLDAVVSRHSRLRTARQPGAAAPGKGTPGRLRPPLHLLRAGRGGGEAFVRNCCKRLKELRFKGEVRQLDCGKFKDPSDLHAADPEKFKERWQKVLADAERLDIKAIAGQKPK